MRTWSDRQTDRITEGAGSIRTQGESLMDMAKSNRTNLLIIIINTYLSHQPTIVSGPKIGGWLITMKCSKWQLFPKKEI